MYKVIIIVVIFCFSFCSDKSAKQEEKPVSPSVETNNYLQAASTFWDGLDYSNLKMLKDSMGVYRAFAAWGNLLFQSPLEEAVKLTGKFIEEGNAYPEMQLQLMMISELCFNDPNSAYRNEELYIPMLEAFINAPFVDEAHKERFRFQYRMAMKNRKEAEASDFGYITEQGKKGTLYTLVSEYVLLYFFNPECHDCARVKEYIARSSVFGQLQKEGLLRVLAIYPDEDLSAWERHLGENPREWITARYASTEDTEAFYLPAIPNLYLLDKGKMVLLKDVSIEQIEIFLENVRK